MYQTKNFEEIKFCNGAILCDQMRSFDWKERRVQFCSQLSPSILEEALDIFVTLLQLK